MKYLLLIIFFSLFSFVVKPAMAVENPLTKPNNKVGIHILFQQEIQDAALLVNSNGGEWGYVVIPIQAGDRDLVKWQLFMDDARKHHLIPIVRLATEGDYFNTKVWRKPQPSDILDFANFLDSLNWPVKNRYIIVFNEVNRSDEWGGSANPAEYADLLSYAVTAFKSVNQDFFIISSGMDNAAATVPGQAFNQYDYMRYMNDQVPDIFSQIDGLSSHSYPNPGFSSPPTNSSPMSIASFKYEQALAQSLGGKKLPIFITETGWSSAAISDEQRADYYKVAFETAWSDDSIVTVSPFLLKAGGGPFTVFSFVKEDGTPSKQYEVVKNLPKVKGTPSIINVVLGTEIAADTTIPVKDFRAIEERKKSLFPITLAAQTAFRFMFRL